MAQEMMRVLTGLYRTECIAILFTARLGIDQLKVPSSSIAADLPATLAANGIVRAVVQAARDQFQKPHSDLGRGAGRRSSAQQHQPVARPGPSFDAAVSESEALLFFDNLTGPGQGHNFRMPLASGILTTTFFGTDFA